MAKIDIEEYTPRLADKFLFDTNVWILLFGSVAGYQKKEQQLYSTFLKNLIDRDRGLYVSSTILSEFANVLLRQEFETWKRSSDNIGKSYKNDFSKTNDYKQQRNLVINLQKKILGLPIVEKVSDNFNGMNISSVHDHFELADFNDALVAELALKQDFKIVTNDRDFFALSDKIDIISALS